MEQVVSASDSPGRAAIRSASSAAETEKLVTSEVETKQEFPRYYGLVTFEEMRATIFKDVTDEEMEAGARLLLM